MLKDKIYKFLLYLTNNEREKTIEEWRHDEIHFDIAFLIIMLILLIIGVLAFSFEQDKWGWLCMLGVEVTWAWDSLRHNRE